MEMAIWMLEQGVDASVSLRVSWMPGDRMSNSWFVGRLVLGWLLELCSGGGITDSLGNGDFSTE